MPNTIATEKLGGVAMSRFRSILVPLVSAGTGPSLALEQAKRLATRDKARLAILGFLPSTPESTSSARSRVESPKGRRRSAETIEAFERMVAPLCDGSVEIEAGIVRGKPAAVIVDEVVRRQHDLLLYASPPVATLARLFSRDLGRTLIRKCPCPVWIVNARPRERKARVLAAVGASGTDDAHDRLDRLVLEAATSFCEATDAELHVARAWRMFGEEILRGRAGVKPSEFDRMSEEIRREHVRAVVKLMVHMGGRITRYRVHLWRGSPEVAIPELAKELDADLVVVGSINRGTGFRCFRRNTAESVVRDVKTSVFVAKAVDRTDDVGASIARDFVGDADVLSSLRT